MHQRSRTRKPRHLAAGAVAILALAAATGACANGGHRAPLSLGSAVRSGLDCPQLAEVARVQLDSALQWESALGARSGVETFAADNGVASGSATTSAGKEATAPAADTANGTVVAGTNVAETGVDEGDIVKTDGRHLVSVVGNTLRVVALDGTPALDGTLALGTDNGGEAQLFLRGDEALVLLASFGGPVGGNLRKGDIAEVGPPAVTGGSDVPAPSPTTLPPEPPIPFTQGVTLVRVDLSNPAAPREVERRTVEGTLVAARMIDGTVRVVVRSQPPVMSDLGSVSGIAEAREVIAHLSADDLLPRVTNPAGGVEALGACADVAVLPTIDSPRAFDARMALATGTGPSTVSVLTLGDTLADLAPTTVEGMADVVYASPSALYVTSTDWAGDGSSTSVHRFDLGGTGAATYTGSGRAPGTLLDQYSMSERNGDLRVVTTVDGVAATTELPATDGYGNPIDQAPAPRPTAGRLTVLRPGEGNALTEVGHLDDLGVGERVQSVRFVGDSAYVVTFRQTDPLFALDLADPTRPTVLGELKTTGFSQYLHPLGDGLLLGLGREATEGGTDTGLKLSLYDVSNPAAPVELDKVVLADAWSAAADDPHAFTWDPVGRQAVFPVERQVISSCPPNAECMVPDASPTTPELAPAPPSGDGALVVRVDGHHLGTVAELRHDDQAGGTSPVVRSVVVDRDLWTLSARGFGRSDADAPATVDMIRF